MNRDKTAKLLNRLIETCRDGEAGFQRSVRILRDAKWRLVCEEFEQSCARGARDLTQKVYAQGGRPPRGGSARGALHRRWLSVKAGLSEKTDQAVLELCERDEQRAKREYQRALRENLPPQVRDLVERQYRVLLDHHQKVRAMRDAERVRTV